MKQDIKVELVEPGTSHEYRGKRSWEKKTIKVNRKWLVTVDGEVAGTIIYRMFTREQKTPGKMYVNSRWESPGWAWKLGDVNIYGGRMMEAYSKSHAVESIVMDYNRSAPTQPVVSVNEADLNANLAKAFDQLAANLNVLKDSLTEVVLTALKEHSDALTVGYEDGAILVEWTNEEAARPEVFAIKVGIA